MIRTVRLTLSALAVAVLALSSRTASADVPGTLSVDSSSSKITYNIVHKLHTVEGTSSKVDGRVKINPDGTVLVQIVAPVASFSSGSSGRDEHMQETMESSKFPTVSFKGRGNISLPSSFPATIKLDLAGELDFHGQRKAETVPVEVTFSSDSDIRVVSKFAVSLDKYGVDRPSLLLVKINDDCKIDLELKLKK